MTTGPQGHLHIPAPTGVPDPLPVATEVEARSFVVYVGMEESAASAAGMSLDRLAGELGHYIESIVPGSQSAAAVVAAPAGAPGTDLEVVRRVPGNPTNRPGAGPDLLQVPAADFTRRHGVVIDLARRQGRLDGEFLDLTYMEFGVLRCLVEHRDRTVGRAEPIDSLWKNADAAPSERTIDGHIRRLRTKLGRLSGIVRTVHGQGYRFHEYPDVTVRGGQERGI
jgi:DNA-binding winged helix-turn-helix (wHTH) protein